MNTLEFLKYKIRKGDTLNSIAKRVGMNPIDLKFFHNKTSTVNERIHFDTLSGNQLLYIPFYYLSTEEKLKEKYTERPSKSFSPAFYAQQYRVQETFYADNQPDFTINYSIDLKFVHDNEEYTAYIQFNDFQRDENAPDDKMILLALACINSVFPIEFKLNQNGEIVSLNDSQMMLKRFRKQRPIMEDYHIGEVAKNYLDTFESSLINENFLINQIKKNTLFQLLFPKRDWFYKTSSWEESFFLSGNSKPRIFQFSADYIHDNRLYVDTMIKGFSVEEDELIIEFKTEKVKKSLVEVSARISSQHNLQHLIKITQLAQNL